MVNSIIMFVIGGLFIFVLISKYIDYKLEELRQIERQDLLNRIMAEDYSEYQTSIKEPEQEQKKENKKERPTLSDVGIV